MDTIISKSPEETTAHGAAVARTLAAGAVLALVGGLGAGKTHFVKGLAQGLGAAPEEVTSPTFTLIHEYIGGRLPLFHLDLYRLETVEEALGLGFDDYLGSEGVLAIEWADKFPELLPKTTRWIYFEVAAEEEVRRITEGAPV